MTDHDMTEEETVADKTRAQLAAENEELRRLLAELQANPTATTRPAPTLPSWGLSEGTRLDILETQNKISHHPTMTAAEITEPFTGKVIRVTQDDAVMLGDDDEVEQPGRQGLETPPPPVDPQA